MARGSRRLAPKGMPAVGIPSNGLPLIRPTEDGDRVELPKIKQMEKSVFQPLGSMVAVIEYDMGKVTDGGIIIPDGVKDFFNTLVAKVIATGKDCKQVKVGDNVLLYHSVQRGIVRYKNEKCTQVEEEFIAGILNADEVVELPLKSES